jgi:drug/metabolite transporter (DMT)-like permease
MTNYKHTIMAILIPILNSISWLLGGALIASMSPIGLTTVRLFVISIILNVLLLIKSNNNVVDLKSKPFTWWTDQLILAASGRAAYYYFSTKSLLHITALDAVLISALLPLIIIFIEMAFQMTSVRLITVFTGLIAISLNILTLSLFSPGGVSGLNIGHFEMLLATIFFAAHTIYYKKTMIKSSPVLSLSIQFTIGLLLLLPFVDITIGSELLKLNQTGYLQLIIYSVVCGLLPFVFMHYSLQSYSPFTLTIISMLAPLFAIALKDLFQKNLVSTNFIVLACATLFFAIMTLLSHSNKNFKLKGPYAK